MQKQGSFSTSGPVCKIHPSRDRHEGEEMARTCLQSMKAMTRPVLPPIFLRALPTFCAAFAIAGPAVAETLDRPSDALEAADEAVSLALEAAWEELCRTAVLRNRNCDCRRSTARDAVTGIFQLATGGKGCEGKNDRQRCASLVQATKSNGRPGVVVGQMDRLVRTDPKGQAGS